MEERAAIGAPVRYAADLTQWPENQKQEFWTSSESCVGREVSGSTTMPAKHLAFVIHAGDSHR
ncbi:hypothetical protein GCM10010512_10160 [Streptomyces thermoviolaceus subsp. thermoviolaceus]|nr:hypothetical protein GCM10010512_10160 [Streptomyces thermoviolaceus subsp. thermoviolaceus]